VFLITGSDQLCPLHQLALSNRLRYHVLDNQNSRYMLVSNDLVAGETDVNPLLEVFHKEPPAQFARQITANFDDTVELLGVDMPERARKGSTFKLTMWLKVLKRPSQNWKVLLHFDQGGVRFQGDHEPARCGMTYWQPGDIIADTFEVKVAPDLTQPTGTYTIYGGFFQGSGGVWTNMEIKSANKTTDNRVPFGTIRVD